MQDGRLNFFQRWGWLIIWAGIVLAVALFPLLDVGGESPWASVAAERGAGYRDDHCEGVDAAGYFLQFHNFWSNSIYLAAGLLILWFNDSWPGKYLGAWLCFLAIGSAWFHGTLTEAGQTVDIAGVYIVLLAVLSYACIEFAGWFYHEPRAVALLVCTTMFGVIAAALRGEPYVKVVFDSMVFVPVLAGLILAVGIRAAFRWPRSVNRAWLVPALIALSTGVTAIVFRTSDGERGDGDLCLYGADSIIQGHALWHTLSGIMFVGMFEYFRSLRNRSLSVFPWRRK